MQFPLNAIAGCLRPFLPNGQGGNRTAMPARVERGCPESGASAMGGREAFRFETTGRSTASTIHKSWRDCSGVVVHAALASFAGTAEAASQFIVQTPGTRITAEIYDVHMLIMFCVLVTFCVVFGVMFHAIYTHRKTVGPHVEKAGDFRQNTTVEIIWTVIPFIILIGMAWPAARSLVGLKDSSNADITIRATGMQWKWGYDYVEGDGEGISFFSNLYAPRRLAVDSATVKSDNYLVEVDNPVVVPVNKKIRMVLSANDAIHSWHIPALGVKQDAIPGLARETWFNAQKIGAYRGLCSIEACGAGRACLLIVVNVVSDSDYKKWVDGKKRGIAANVDDPDRNRTFGALTESGGKSYAAN